MHCCGAERRRTTEHAADSSLDQALVSAARDIEMEMVVVSGVVIGREDVMKQARARHLADEIAERAGVAGKLWPCARPGSANRLADRAGST